MQFAKPFGYNFTSKDLRLEICPMFFCYTAFSKCYIGVLKNLI